jgi:hypothetical protein
MQSFQSAIVQSLPHFFLNSNPYQHRQKKSYMQQHGSSLQYIDIIALLVALALTSTNINNNFLPTNITYQHQQGISWTVLFHLRMFCTCLKKK